MKYTLTDYQEVASSEVLRRLRRATRDFEEDRDYSAVSLTAPTGAGKTVIATDVIERLFFGDDSTAPDPEATVIWVTDNPSLNEQTRRKMLMASTGLKPAHLVTIDTGFDQEQLEANRVYFLNIQKLGKATSFVTSGTDARRWSLWDTLKNTIKARGGHLYVIIDEAHRGTGAAEKSRPTIVKRIISDPEGAIPPVPVVWGISATPERFDQAMQDAASPSRVQSKVSVPAEDVRTSGLLKDTLDIRHPDETQPSDATLTRLAAENLKMMHERWAAYAEEQDEPPVKPVLVVQVRAQVTDGALGEILGTLRDSWSVLGGRAVGHSFDNHAALNINGQSVRYIAPEDIQDDPDLRVVLFKEALTTGWDCPRAEVMLSFRKAEDVTYIAQLIGRMVRTPLARRVTTDDMLNTVSLFLPHYDRDSVEQVVDRLESDPNKPPVIIVRNAIECPVDEAVDKKALDVIRDIPTYVVPGRAHKSQVSRLRTLATRLTGDGIVDNATKTANQHLIDTIERERKRLTDEGKFDALVTGLGRIDIGRLTVSMQTGERVRIEEHSSPDSRDINNVFGAAKRGFRDGLANTYWAWLLDQEDQHGDPDDPLLPDDAKLIVAALASDPTVVESVENAAKELVNRWLHDNSRAIANLPDAAKSAYSAVRAQAKDSELSNLILPKSIQASEPDGVSYWDKHIYVTAKGDHKGKFPGKFNEWEADVIRAEIAAGAVAWYRNPTGSDAAVRVPYRDGEFDKALYPDFVFIHKNAEGELVPSIVDPHNYSYGDTGPKWRGLAAYAAAHGDKFQRIDAVIKDPDDNLLRLDLKDPTIKAALEGKNSKDEILQVFRDHGGAY